jgi:hypothetical protein
MKRDKVVAERMLWVTDISLNRKRDIYRLYT